MDRKQKKIDLCIIGLGEVIWIPDLFDQMPILWLDDEVGLMEGMQEELPLPITSLKIENKIDVIDIIEVNNPKKAFLTYPIIKKEIKNVREKPIINAKSLKKKRRLFRKY